MSERQFSAAGQLITKLEATAIRNRLEMDCMVFLPWLPVIKNEWS